MDRQKGFTLIELLLVLAIIGIISAIALPALLGQRARARDEVAISNVVGHTNDLVGQYEREKELGLPPEEIVTGMKTYLDTYLGTLRSPWGDGPAFVTQPVVVTGATTQAEFEALMAPTALLGNARIYLQHPGEGVPGYLGLVTLTSQHMNGSPVFRKSAHLD